MKFSSKIAIHLFLIQCFWSLQSSCTGQLSVIKSLGNMTPTEQVS